jgi:transcriptional regulator with XRE-family HTH domain
MRTGYKIKILREKNRIPQSELAQMLNISQSSLCNIENGKIQKVDFHIVDKLSQIFKVDLSFFSEYNDIKDFKENIEDVVGNNYNEASNSADTIIGKMREILNSYNKESNN